LEAGDVRLGRDRLRPGPDGGLKIIPELQSAPSVPAAALI
jgi:hypothetical protein